MLIPLQLGVGAWISYLLHSRVLNGWYGASFVQAKLSSVFLELPFSSKTLGFCSQENKMLPGLQTQRLHCCGSLASPHLVSIKVFWW